MDKVRAMLKEKNLPNSFWGEAVLYANFILNRSPKKKLKKTPYEIYKGMKPNFKMLKIFGSPCMFVNLLEHRKKLDDRAFEGVFCGINETETFFRIFVKGQKIIHSRDVKFYESGEEVFNQLCNR